VGGSLAVSTDVVAREMVDYSGRRHAVNSAMSVGGFRRPRLRRVTVVEMAMSWRFLGVRRSRWQQERARRALVAWDGGANGSTSSDTFWYGEFTSCLACPRLFPGHGLVVRWRWMAGDLPDMNGEDGVASASWSMTG